MTSSTGLRRWIPTPSHLLRRRTEWRFTVRRPARAEVSPCCHRPSGGDVACRVHVSVARPRAASDALENRLALMVFRRDMPTVGAALRRVRRWDEFQPSRCLMLQPGNQQSPPLAANLTVEAPLLRDLGARAFTTAARRPGHGTHIQILDADGVEASRQIGGGLLRPVTPAIRFAGAQPGNRQLGLCMPARPALRPSHTLLQSAQPRGFLRAQARNAEQLPAGQRNRYRHTAINTNDAAVVGSRDSFGNGSKSEVPTPRPIQIDSVGLHSVGDVAGPSEPYPTNLRYPYLLGVGKQPKPAHINNIGTPTDNLSEGGRRRFLSG